MYWIGYYTIDILYGLRQWTRQLFAYAAHSDFAALYIKQSFHAVPSSLFHVIVYSIYQCPVSV